MRTKGILQKERTGIFFPRFQGQRLKDFPQALADVLDKDNVSYYDGVYASDNPYYVKPATEEMLIKVHSRDMIERISRTGYYEAASYSAGGTVQAALEILEGLITLLFLLDLVTTMLAEIILAAGAISMALP